jgi:hypothetical protein
VKELGRSKIKRRAVAAGLRRRRANAIRAAYVRAYGDRNGVADDLAGWTDEGSWPVE